MRKAEWRSLQGNSGEVKTGTGEPGQKWRKWSTFKPSPPKKTLSFQLTYALFSPIQRWVRNAMATQSQAAAHYKAITYRALDPSNPEIRLLEIQPVLRDVSSAAVVCRLVNTRITPELEFIGLSALVGGSGEKKNIWINSHKIAVPANLEEALRHVRTVFLPSAHTKTDTGPRTSEDSWDRGGKSQKPTHTEQISAKPAPGWLRRLLKGVASILPDDQQKSHHHKPQPLRVWADTICINSLDTNEAAKQQHLLREAYQHAKLVVGWLGVKDESTDIVIQTIRTIDKAMPSEYGTPEDRDQHPENYAPHYAWMKDMMELWTLPPGLTNLDEWPIYAAMRDFMQRPYFQREWILREISMAKFPAFLLGDEIVSWKQVLRMNRATEELVENGADVFPEEFRKKLSFFPLSTIYALLGEFERRQVLESPGKAMSSASSHSTA